MLVSDMPVIDTYFKGKGIIIVKLKDKNTAIARHNTIF